MTQSCATCIHRPQGDARMHIDCTLFAWWWLKNKPNPKNFGATCKRHEGAS